MASPTTFPRYPRNWRGPYDSDSQYYPGDEVSFENGNTYVTTAPVSGISPTASAVWEKAASRGLTGETGLTGVRGPIGPAGDFPNVLNYGALGDGTTDDTAAIQSLITAEKTIVIPPSPSGLGYLISAPLDIPSDRLVMGFGWSSRLIKRNVKVGHAAIRGANTENGVRNVTLQNVHVEGDWNRVTPKDWKPDTNYSVGAIVKKAGLTVAEGTTARIFRATTAGTSGSTEPAWTTTQNATYQDGTVVWTEYGTAQEPFGFYFNAQNPVSSTNGISTGSINENITLIGCLITNWAGVSYRFNGVDGLKVIGSTAHMNTRGGFVASRTGRNIQMIGCQATQLGDDLFAVNAAPLAGGGNPQTDFRRIIIASNIGSSRTDAEFGSGAKLIGGTGAYVGHNIFENTKNAGVTVEEGAGTIPTNVTVDTNTLLSPKGDGVEVTASQFNGLKITNNSISYPAAHGVKVKSPDGSAPTSGQDLEIATNRVRVPGSASFTNGAGFLIDGPLGSTIRNLVVEINKVRGAAGRAVYITANVKPTVGGVKGNIADNCAAEGSTSPAIEIGSCDRFTVRANEVYDTRTPASSKRHTKAIVVASSTKTVVTANTAYADETTTGTAIEAPGANVTGNFT